MSQNIPPAQLEAIKRAIAAGLAPLRADPPMPYSTWAEKHFEMDEESSHRRGLWEPWPFQIGWMDAFSNDDIFEVDVEKAKRVGYTKTIVGFGAYNASHRRRKQAIWQPTDDDRDSFEKSEISPAFDICKALAPVRRAGRDDDTIKFKRFRGSVLHLLGAKAARSFRRITIAVAILDELDAMDQVVEKTIDPFTGAVGRLEGAPFPKVIAGTTPRHKLTSHIRRRVECADAVMQYEIPCPHCGVSHPLRWGGKDVAHGFKWENNDPNTVRHVCPHCHEAIAQADYLATWKQGLWVSRCGNYTYDHIRKLWLDGDSNPRKAPRHVAFVNVWTAYSPQRTWPDIVREFLEARKAQKVGDNGPMQGFKNETLADVWEEEFEHTDASLLRERAKTDIDIPLQIVPEGACKIVMGIDTQADRWEAVAWAVGRGEEMWPIDYRVIYGSPAVQEEWAEKLDPVIKTIYKHVNGHDMPIDAVGIDTGGTNWTHQAYNYCRARTHHKVYATKGDQALGAPIKMKPSWVDVNAFGRTLKRGIKLWRICVDTAKDLLHGRLDQVKTFGRGYVHLNRNLPPQFFDQLAAEHRIRVRVAHGWADRWVCPSGHRNEVLDCTVIAMFLCQVLGLHTTPDSTWDAWERDLAPNLFSTPPVLPAPAASVETSAPPPDPEPPAQAPVQPAPSAPASRPATRFAKDEWSRRGFR
ncbi:MAG: Replicative helicase (DnaB) [Rhodocyclaceae bacterium]|nr:Replicative helicase (DnaB) [Rhodocyclaceae bacterium]